MSSASCALNRSPLQISSSAFCRPTRRGSSQGAAVAGDQPDIHVGHPEARLLRGDADVRHRAHVHAGADRRAVDRGDVGLVQVLEGLRHALHAVAQRVAAHRRGPALVRGEDRVLLGARLHVGAGAEGAARAGHDDDAHALILGGAGDRGGPARQQLRAERVHPLGAVERDRRDAVVHLVGDVLVLHANRLSAGRACAARLPFASGCAPAQRSLPAPLVSVP